MSQARVLIVDDDPALLQALPEALQLRMDGVTVDVADSAAAALGRIAARDYDAIVTDIKMPGMDGFALLAEIRTRWPDTPTLLITGHGEHDLVVDASAAGPTTSSRSQSTGITSSGRWSERLRCASWVAGRKSSSSRWSATSTN